MSIRQFLISTIALAMLPPAILRAADTAEYTSGTVKSIPLNSVGALNADDLKVLRFFYGQTVYRLPYDQITGTEIAKGETHRVMKKFPLPSLFGRSKETLTITFKDASGATGTLSFELAGRYASSIQDSIAELKTLPPSTVANGSNDWWGDRYWKTNRNKSTWEEEAASAQKTTPPATPAPAAAPATKN